MSLSFVPPELMSLARPNPAMNRWAIAVCPSGTYVFSALRTRHVRTESAGLALAAAFGVRQLVGAFARGTGGSAASWLALAENSGDKSPHSKRWRDCETTPCVDARSVRRAKQVPGTSSGASEFPNGIILSPLTRFAVVSSYFSPS